MRRAIADTSVFIGFEGQRFDAERFADFEWGVSAVTLGELRLGVLQARDPVAASRRLSTYQLAQRFEPIPVDEAVSEAWALLVSRLRALGRKAPINDSWIAATAIAFGVPVVTQDADYDQMPGVEVIRL
ncbi:type II toxin-antitoxin system VapC family toxin [Planotetraspora silvatica]|uniref:type II toxin-antitoxin system VapC family toxin n=1 Tax=Planotetraspora silvatica TaxID=234614 RepID=UPI0023B3582A|nr:type II toxin-antitoxin system VapC family toxin [Planotetraspora silvatica]